MAELTDWIKGVPARKGVYQRRLPHGNRYAYWDGKRWGGYSNDVETANSVTGREYVSAFQTQPYRGLAQKPA